MTTRSPTYTPSSLLSPSLGKGPSALPLKHEAEGEGLFDPSGEVLSVGDRVFSTRHLSADPSIDRYGVIVGFGTNGEIRVFWDGSSGVSSGPPSHIFKAHRGSIIGDPVCWATPADLACTGEVRAVTESGFVIKRDDGALVLLVYHIVAHINLFFP